MLQRSDIIGHSFASLPPATQQELAVTLRPNGPFTDEQRKLMRGLWLLVDNPQTLADLNKVKPTHQMGKRETTDGRVLLLVDLLTNCRQGEAFDHAREWLFSLQIVEVEENEFPVPEPIQ